MESEQALARFRQRFGEEYAAFLAAEWGPPPHLCPFCLTATLRKLLIGDPARKIGDAVSVKWYMWCDSCLRGIYCPPGTYTVRPGKPYVLWSDKEAVRNALPAGLKLIQPVAKIAETAESDAE